MIQSSEFSLAQRDGGPPTVMASGSAPGESGVSILNVRFHDGAHFSATPRQHLVWFQTSVRARMECRIAGRELDQEEDADGDDGKNRYRLQQPPADQNQRTMHEEIMGRRGSERYAIKETCEQAGNPLVAPGFRLSPE